MIPPLHQIIPNSIQLIRSGFAAKKMVDATVKEPEWFSGSALTTLCMIAETIVNRALAFDPATRRKLPYLHGKVLSLRLRSPNIHIYVSVAEGDEGCEIKLGQYSEVITTELTGDCIDVLRLVRQPQASLANTGVQVRGSTALLQQWMAIFNGLDIDWEDALIQQLGSLPGHQLAEVLRLIGRSQLRHFHHFTELTHRFLSEEAEWVPHRAQFEALQERVSRLRDEVDRLVASTSAPRS